MKVLLVEDDPDLLDLVQRGLRDEGMRVDVASSYRDAARKAKPGAHDVLILDVLIPGGTGIGLCRQLRQDGNKAPVLFLTALGAEADRMAGFAVGGDDYLTKPFSFRELVARLRALARRPPGLLRTVVRVADLEADLDARTVRRGATPISLTTQEWSLLECFLRHRDRVLSRAEITAYVWDDNHDPFASLLEVLVWRLRRKVDEGFTPRLIHTVRGAGYRFGT